MRRYLIYAIVLLSACLPAVLKAEVWTPETLPIVHLQDARRYVCNPDGVLSPAIVDSIDAILYHLERTKGVQTVVVAVKRIENGDPYEFGRGLFMKYGIGSKTQNTGLVVVLSTEDRKYYILTGYGMEGVLPDVILHRVEQTYMVPEMRQSNWDSATYQGVKALSLYIEEDEELKAELSDADDLKNTFVGFFSIAIIIFLLVFVSIISERNRISKCPRCGKRTLVYVSRTFLYDRGDFKYYRVIKRCKNCGNSFTSVEKVIRPEIAAINGTIIGSSFGNNRGGGGYFGGGGFGGGHFGGGGFGGGGAGGSF